MPVKALGAVATVGSIAPLELDTMCGTFSTMPSRLAETIWGVPCNAVTRSQRTAAADTLIGMPPDLASMAQA